MNLGIDKKKAIVLAGSSGIGLGIAESLIQEGVQVAIIAKNGTKLQTIAEQIGAATFEAANLYDPKQTIRAVKAVQDFFGGSIDILVTNNGGPPKGAVQELSLDDWQYGFEGLWKSTIAAITTVLPSMREQKWGRIVLVTSVAAKDSLLGGAVSSGLRAGLLGLTKSLSHEVAPYGITVNALLPGYTITPATQPSTALIEKIPLGRYAAPREQGAMVAFLASLQASYVTGQAVAVDGGLLKSI